MQHASPRVRLMRVCHFIPSMSSVEATRALTRSVTPDTTVFWMAADFPELRSPARARRRSRTDGAKSWNWPKVSTLHCTIPALVSARGAENTTEHMPVSPAGLAALACTMAPRPNSTWAVPGKIACPCTPWSNMSASTGESLMDMNKLASL